MLSPLTHRLEEEHFISLTLSQFKIISLNLNKVWSYLNNDLLAIGGLDDLLALACGDHPPPVIFI